jgi:NAD dependent epimerase/dehydratase family enzyme
MSWITLDDLLNALFFCMQQESLSGAVNFVSPEPVRNSEFTKALGGALHRPAVLPAPAFALRLAFGQMADEALLSSCRAVPAKLQAAGFAFRSPSIEPALKTLLG